MRAQWVLLLVIIPLIVSNAEELYRKVVHETDPEAKCLDGSPAAIYLHEGDPRKIMFYMQGGASCGRNSYS